MSAGTEQSEILIRMTAPGSTGTYDFSIVVSVPDCTIDDCMKTVSGKLIVVSSNAEEPQENFKIWLAPGTKNVIGTTKTTFVGKVQNYGEGQTFSISLDLEDGIESNYIDEPAFIPKGSGKTFTFDVVPLSGGAASYKITLTVVALGPLKYLIIQEAGFM